MSSIFDGFDPLDVKTLMDDVRYLEGIIKHHESKLQGIEQKVENCLSSLYSIAEHLDVSAIHLHSTAAQFDQMKNTITHIIDVIKYMQNPEVTQLPICPNENFVGVPQ